ncbi:flippase-like domain-containing protein [Candidatus Saccharibacteria bacterium]|nr:flippase-like domain-containing protein [Candidatus Saccharibacteria bacterium]
MADEKRAKRWKLIITIATFVALGGLIYAVRDQIMDTIKNFGEVNSGVLILMFFTQALSYGSYTRMYRHLFGILGHNIPFKRMLRINIELNFVNSVFPSGGVSGFSYFGLRMKSEGVSTGQSTLVQLMRFILIFVSFQVLLFAGLLILALGGQASNLVILIAGSLATLLFVGTLGMMFIVGSKKRINSFFTYITRFVNRLIHLVRKNNPETISIARVEKLFTELHENYMLIKKNPHFLKWPLVHALMANIAEITTIYVVYVAFGQWVNPGAVIIAYAIANFAGLVSVLPGGVGIYEGLMTAVLATAGVPAGVSIPVTIMYRILNMTIQLPVGYFFYHKTVHTEGISARRST